MMDDDLRLDVCSRCTREKISVGGVANKSATSLKQVGNFPVYGEVTGKRV